MKTFLTLMAGLFALFTYFQLNDATQYKTADPAVIAWILGYAFTSISTLLAALSSPPDPKIKKALPQSIHRFTAIFTFALAILRATQIDWTHSLIFCHESNPAANETGGLLILCAWHSFLAFKILQKKNA